MNKQNNKTSLLVKTALLTALVFVCTILLKIPVGPDCYIHLGDAVIVLSVLMLPLPYACFAGAVGATLADLLGGFAFWAPWTFAVKLIMILVLGFLVGKSRTSSSEKSILGIHYIEFSGLVLGSVVAILGYFVSEYMLFGSWLPAATCIPFNIIQTALGCTVAELLYHRIK